MNNKATFEIVEREADSLTQEEQLELVERLIHKLRKTHTPKTKRVEWQDLYGLGKGLWKEDAQEYVNRSREDRL